MTPKIKLPRTHPDRNYPDYKGYQIVWRKFKFKVMKDGKELEWLHTLQNAKRWIDRRIEKGL